MRSGNQQERFTSVNSKLLGVNFHRFTDMEPNATNVELASEFGLSNREVRQLKKHLERN
ncbi:hypothetical protein LGQ02_06285 [Bacillus shivajii]|uniref:hypothetical protein n=1 Tax=Bacillus shivajii TaxID=1983719 RepID=UPI001CFA2DC6|nr:hypothetical protein [Bacillus shivajii]UCZ54367.1 hypothetical protein LGQ02_06285 [Bacillus shivajii]